VRVGLATLGHTPVELLQIISSCETSPWPSLYINYKDLSEFVAELGFFSQAFSQLSINKITSKENDSH